MLRTTPMRSDVGAQKFTPRADSIPESPVLTEVDLASRWAMSVGADPILTTCAD